MSSGLAPLLVSLLDLIQMDMNMEYFDTAEESNLGMVIHGWGCVLLNIQLPSCEIWSSPVILLGSGFLICTEQVSLGVTTELIREGKPEMQVIRCQ